MKKILMCLLSLGLITGCAQQVQEQPEEPSVVEEPSKDNESITIESDDNGENEIENSKDTELPEGYYSITIPKNERPEYLYATEIIGRNLIDITDDHAFKYNSSNDFLNWVANFDATIEKTEHLHLDLPGAYADELNQYFDELFYSEVGRFAWQTVSGWSESTQDVLSIVIRRRSSTQDGSYKGQWLEAYNIDFNTYSPLTNEQLLEMYGLDFETAQSIINNDLEQANILPCKEEISNICHYSSSEELDKVWIALHLSSSISNDSIVFIDNQGHLNMLIYVDYRNLNRQAYYNEEVSNFYMIELIE